MLIVTGTNFSLVRQIPGDHVLAPGRVRPADREHEVALPRHLQQLQQLTTLRAVGNVREPGKSHCVILVAGTRVIGALNTGLDAGKMNATICL